MAQAGGARVERVEELGGVLLEHGTLVIVVVDQVLQAFGRAAESLGIGIHVRGDERAHGVAVFVELYAPVAAVQIEHGVERVVVLLWVLGHGWSCGWVRKNSMSPFLTARTSALVPMSSKRYMSGTWHLRAMMGPAAA